MAKKTNWQEDMLLAKGFTPDGKGGYNPPPMKSKYIQSLRDKSEFVGDVTDHEIIEKKVVKQTPDFIYTPKTEWFINTSVPSKKNSRINFVNKNGKQLSLPSKKHAEYVATTEMQYDVFGKEFRAAVKHYNICPPYLIEFTFIRSTKHSFDYCNACQTCEDMMKDQVDKKGNIKREGWFTDDSADFIIPSFKPYQYDKENPGVKIKLIID